MLCLLRAIASKFLMCSFKVSSGLNDYQFHCRFDKSSCYWRRLIHATLGEANEQ